MAAGKIDADKGTSDTEIADAGVSRMAAEGKKSESSSDQIVHDVVSGIYEGRYVAGQRLVEPDLMRRYSVSRSTVREAIKRLSAEGILTVHSHRGAQVRHLTRREAHGILLILELMIGLAARLAADGIMRPGSRQLFVEAFEELLKHESSVDSYEMVPARNRFYRMMAKIADNPELERILRSIQVHLVRTNLKLPQKQRFNDYRKIAKAILAGDGDAAEKAARDHVRRIAAGLTEVSDRSFAPEEAGNP
ncbi:MAG: GntR family transcriptional regulator [Mesorhizobium sp.]|nr:GntR family transcriptional regulator [Mesorhizobium sp.]MCO5163688.1 GntR family transcriptional regulator [Mesorhizobium sp.]